MKREEVLKLYDGVYSSNYDELFLLGENFLECTEFEVSLLKELMDFGDSWLDVACGTGYFLSRFPKQRRSGLDISPAMLDIARKANPGVAFYESDFRGSNIEWNGCWDLVSCMWYAYCYSDSVTDVDRVIANLADWTSSGGTLFLPVCDPNVICKAKIPYQPPPDSNDGRIIVSAITWSWIDEPSGKCHSNLVSPTLEHVQETLNHHFEEVQLLQYPRFKSDCLESRKAFIAKQKKA